MKKTINIVEFLEWAFNEELPKGGGKDGIASVRSAWGRIMAWSEHLTVIYQGSGVMDYIDRGGEPHPDAVLAGKAVKALAEAVMDLPDDWNPLPGQVMTAAAREAIDEAIRLVRGGEGTALRLLPVGIVVRCAVLRRWPDFSQNIQVRETPVMNNGRPAWFVKRKGVSATGREIEIEMDGYNPKTQRPLPGAYRKWEMSKEIIADIAGRAEWQMWRAALDMVFEDLAGQLADHELLPCDLPLEPWVDGLPERRQARVLQSQKTDHPLKSNAYAKNRCSSLTAAAT